MGPACDDEAVLADMVNHGVDIFRINAAHGTRQDFEKKVAAIARVREVTGFPVAILLDLAGPKIRLGQLAQDPLEVEPGKELFFVRGERPQPLTNCAATIRVCSTKSPSVTRLCWPTARSVYKLPIAPKIELNAKCSRPVRFDRAKGSICQVYR